MDEQRAIYIRWTVVNALGWFGGLTLGGLVVGAALLLALISPNPIYLLSLPLAGMLIGLCVGFAQRWLLGDDLDEKEQRHWLYLSAGGGAVGAVLALIGAWLSGLGWLVGGAAVGAFLAGSVATGQWFILRHYLYPARRWIVVHIAGGAVCGVITLLSNGGLALPLCCGAGALFLGGLVTWVVIDGLRITTAEITEEGSG
jgi:hypothetical protein